MRIMLVNPDIKVERDQEKNCSRGHRRAARRKGSACAPYFVGGHSVYEFPKARARTQRASDFVSRILSAPFGSSTLMHQLHHMVLTIGLSIDRSCETVRLA